MGRQAGSIRQAFKFSFFLVVKIQRGSVTCAEVHEKSYTALLRTGLANTPKGSSCTCKEIAIFMWGEMFGEGMRN